MPTTVLVTGATGFVGSHTLEALAVRPDLRLVAACPRSPRSRSVSGTYAIADTAPSWSAGSMSCAMRRPGHPSGAMRRRPIACIWSRPWP